MWHDPIYGRKDPKYGPKTNTQNEYFEDLFSKVLENVAAGFANVPPQNGELSYVVQNKDGVDVIMVAVPGLKKEQLDIQILDDKQLVVSYDNAKSHTKNTFVLPFKKTFDLVNCDTDKVRATCVDGVLEVTVPHRQAKSPTERNKKVVVG